MLWSLSLLSPLGLLAAASPPVKVSLRTSWPAPPFLVEVVESVALDNPAAFFPLLDRVTDPEVVTITPDETPEAVYSSSLQVATDMGLFSEPGSLAFIEMNLALHAATPKIQAFYHHYTESVGATAYHEGCGSWVDWYGTVVCDVESLAQLAGLDTIDSTENHSSNYTRPKILPFDHIYPPVNGRLETPPRSAILYASLSSPNFRELHTYLMKLAYNAEPRIEYIVRHVPPGNIDPSKRSYLSGYSVALDLKKMDYLALDDRHLGVQQDDRSRLDDIEIETAVIDPIFSLLDKYPENSTASDVNTPPTEDELQNIGYQASQLVLDSVNPLLTLLHLSQNFPKYVTTIARRVLVKEPLAEEIHENQLRVQGGANAMWLNGVSVSEKDLNAFGLLRLMKKERKVMMDLTSLGLERGEAIELLTHPILSLAQESKDVLDGLVDATDRIEGGDVIIWWNDLEKDKRYNHWGASITGLLRPLYPGQFHMIKLNLFNVVLALDLSRPANLVFVAGTMHTIIERGLPFRFGVVPIAETDDGAQMARLVYFLLNNFGRKITMHFLKRIAHPYSLPGARDSFDWSTIRREYDNLMASEAAAGADIDQTTVEFNSVISGKTSESKILDGAQAYAQRLSATLSSSPTGHGFINGKHYTFDENFLRNMQTEISRQLMHLQEEIYMGHLTDEDNERISTYFFDLPTTAKRRNKFVVPSKDEFDVISLPELLPGSGSVFAPSAFVYPTDSEVIPVSIFVVADLDAKNGLEFVKEALSSMEKDSNARLAFIHNPATDDSTQDISVSSIFAHLVDGKKLSRFTSVQLLQALDDGEVSSEFDTADSQVPFSTVKAFKTALELDHLDHRKPNVQSAYIEACQWFARSTGIEPGQNGIVVNGRIIGAIGPKEFLAADFQSLQEYEMLKRIQPVFEALEDIRGTGMQNLDRATVAHVVSMASSAIASIQVPEPSEVGLFDAPRRPRNRNYRTLESQYTLFEVGDNSTALYHIAVIVDPLSETAQKWSSLLQWIAHIPDTYLEIRLNPTRYSDVPLKRFFRYNLRTSLSFDEAGQEVSSQTVFENLPLEPIYTLAMDVPSSWLVRPREAMYDLDNIQLGSLSTEDSSVDTIFDLDYIVVEGHARDTTTQSPPRGLQLQLVSGSAPIDDTQVVANLGYFQFKTKPGVYNLEIREGRGRDIFVTESVGNDGWDSPSVAEVGNEITVTSFEGQTLYPQFSRLPGMEREDVLAEPEEEESSSVFGSMFSSVKSLFKSHEATVEVAEEQADINIFTVASGLLYERFVGIMILSVLRNTKSTVKFWFIENFLSPSFLEFIPHLAEAYHFKYELVTYKWPSWLRAQKEKQRIIWAYKILFLDVLFPMDLKKVIFVDADQIVRADLQELVDLDLHGAPYGYTPMGDDNEAMEGFRFWKTGYWADFLQGKPYHISALYVVDLVRFRQIAAGDILRGSYQQLSMDPNSLANLDQDLPNNLQREVPIYSLHEDWLWCETWCSKDRLHRAKTIDLCQNPLTKEPKLARARQIPEWEEYDSEIARFARKLAEEGKIRSRIATADANALAQAQTASGAASPNPDIGIGITPGEEVETKTEIRDEL
ncbi:UDP-glucose:glycoprotein glucosyltransferase-domain-containing protein [Lentinula raphanica]|uniref:UDP-glucose:glycoprotein glucosyltransferase-domain-containing protein n=1 Tax=Lentinula raphanica TaxID=153919 RepID=A0AA38U640_9AGAR|nr:UDP-glucose:glycoprotein glucosyltransferase-domain-containing protein [Lentinula raphanica]